MAFTFVQENDASEGSGSGQSSLAVALTGVTAGSLIAVFVKWQAYTVNATVSDGTSSFTAGTKYTRSGDDTAGQWFYLLSANSGNRTYTVTFDGTGGVYPRIFAHEYTYTGGSCVYDTEAGNHGTGTTSITSGNLTTTGTDELVFGGYAEVDVPTLTSEAINGLAATASWDSDGYATTWYRAFASTFTGAATGTLSATPGWVVAAIAFKITSGGGGGGSAVAAALHHLRQQGMA